MLDIKFIRENADLVKEGAKKKYIDIDIDRLLIVDDERRKLTQAIEEKRAEQNSFKNKIASEEDVDKKQEMIEQMRTVKEGVQEEEEKLKKVMNEWQTLMVQVPNVPDMTVPAGKDDNDNQEIRVWGEKPEFSFEPKGHIELMQMHDMLDLERGTKVSGFRGYFLKNDGALLNFALWQFAIEHFTNKAFTPMIVPSLVRRDALLGTGYLPQGEEDLYKTQDDDYLAGTSEVAVMNYYADEILKKEDLPKKFFAFSPCFRREAGSHGKDTKGIMRVHEFFKFEQVILSEASHEESVKFHEEINSNTEEMIKMLEIPYHVVVNCGGDLGLGQVKKYDIELWVPSEKKYREISSASYFHDFQTRRLNIRYKDDDGKMKFAHSLNATALPTPRALIAIIENNQKEDGTIKVPEVLQKYIGKDVIGK